MIDAFRDNPLLLLFVVIAIGYGIGSIRVGSFKLGVAAVLFVGLGFGALAPDLQVPQILIFLGLAIFVYTVGLSSGPAFFAGFRKDGPRDLIFALLTIGFSAALAVGLHFLFQFDAATTAGLYAGSSTNTPALAALLDLIEETAVSGEMSELSQRAVVGYSLSYPMGVLGVIFTVGLLQRLLGIDYSAEAAGLQKDYPMGEKLSSQTVVVENEAAIGMALRDFIRRHDLSLAFGRMQHNEEMRLTDWGTQLERGDRIMFVGTESEVQRAIPLFGRAADDKLNYDRSTFDVRRIFVSNPATAGRSVASLNLNERFAASVTRVQRGDMDLLARGDTILELGDRVVVVARRQDLEEINQVFGNSYEGLSTINLTSFGLGLALGLLLGMITFELPGDVSFRLGFAGGPLLVALVLGYLRRSGKLVWSLPYGANLTLRQFGLILLLAGIGIRSGHTFVQTIVDGGGGLVFLSGAIIAALTTIFTLLIGFKLFKIPFSFLTGMVGSQPAILDYALEQAGNKYPTIGYTRMLPIALIAKILFTQVVFAMLGSS